MKQIHCYFDVATFFSCDFSFPKLSYLSLNEKEDFSVLRRHS